jgi:hypothetical protein
VLIHFPTLTSLKVFSDYLEEITDPCYYKAINSSRGLSRDIYLPIGNVSVDMAFSVDEFDELKQTIRRFLEEENAFSPPVTTLETVFINDIPLLKKRTKDIITDLDENRFSG